MLSKRKRKILFFVSVDWFFYSHFYERASSAKRAGYEVIVLTSLERCYDLLDASEFRVIDFNIDRKSLNPVSALKTIIKLICIFRHERPDILHQVAIKPILLGSIAARVVGIKKIVNAMVGGGYAFTSTTYIASLLRHFMMFALRILLNPKGSVVVFENKDDLSSFIKLRLVRPERVVLIRGAGVKVENYSQRTVASVVPLIVVPARLLWDKGLAEFVLAARLLHSQGFMARFAIVGGKDPANLASIPSTVLEKWRAEGSVELWGFQSNMPKVLADSDIVCLPSYREGLPKALLEGMAAGLPCVTTDVPGCREAVVDGQNGLLVPPRDHISLAAALSRLIIDPELRLQMGMRGRNMATTEFASSIICRQTLEIYEKLFQS